MIRLMNCLSECVPVDSLNPNLLMSQILLSTLMPYILPFLLLIYPLVVLVKTLIDLEEGEPVRIVTKNILIVVLSHIALRSGQVAFEIC